MPCWEVRTVNVEFKAANAALLDKALKELGWQYRVDGKIVRVSGRSAYDSTIELDLVAGRATIQPEQQARLNELKRAYAKQAVKLAAKLNGWRVVEKGNKGLLQKGCL